MVMACQVVLNAAVLQTVGKNTKHNTAQYIKHNKKARPKRARHKFLYRSVFICCKLAYFFVHI